MNAFLFGCCWKISRASCGIPIVICFAMVLGRPAPFLAPPLDFLLGVSWMLFILFVFLQCSLKSMGWGFRPFPFALRAFRPFCAFAIWTLRWDLVQLRNRKYRLNTLLLLLRVQLATTYALGWVAVILKGCAPFDYNTKMRISFEINKCSSCLCSEEIRFFFALKCTFLKGDSVKFLSILRRILWISHRFRDGLCEILVDFVADSVKFLSISWRILWNSCRFSDGFCEILVWFSTDSVKIVIFAPYKIPWYGTNSQKKDRRLFGIVEK